MLLRDTPNDDPLLAESKNARLVNIVKRAQARIEKRSPIVPRRINLPVCHFR